MAKIAIDVVLLPSEAMTNQAIEANKKLLKQYPDRIILDKEHCLPHISLAMGCMDERHITDIEKILKEIAEKYNPGLLSIVSINIGTNSLGEKVSSFEVKKTKRLLSLHEEVMRRMTPYFSYDVSAEMVLSPPKASESTLLWIKNYPEKSAFENFFPHITIGYGQMDDFSFTAEFTASKLALCHLGNHCTCRKVLAAVELEQ
jgi:2'-5' RNA ligase